MYLGSVIGSVIAMPCYDTLNTKCVLIGAVVMQMASLSVFMVSSNYTYLACGRFLSGLFQVFVQILAPVWVDVYGPNEHKTKWLTILIGAGPLGMVAGYILAAAVVTFWDWKWAFGLKIIILGALVCILMLLSSSSIDVSKRQQSEKKQEESNRILTPFEIYQMQKNSEAEVKIRGMSFWGRLWFCLTNVDLMSHMLTLMSLFWITTGLQFWMTDYLVAVIGLEQHVAF